MSLDRRTLLQAAPAALFAVTHPASAGAAPMTRSSPIVELRQYTLRGGQRDVLISLFEKEFVESQEALGATIIGTFRDLDDPDRFVWLRGFSDMEARKAALTDFYGGPVWKAHRHEANATIVDSDNVLLLHPAAPGGGFDPGPRDKGRPGGVITATVHYVPPALVEGFAAWFAQQMRPRIEAHGATVLATFVTETSPNTFPRLPIRADDHVLTWFARFSDERQEHAFAEAMRRESGWRDSVPEALLPAMMRKPERLRLEPTRRSRLR